jgi:hypothetical protein
VPDAAGPHSAGRPGVVFTGGLATGDGTDDDEDKARFAISPATLRSPDGQASGAADRPLRPVGQLPVLIRRDVEVIARARRTQAILASVPVAILLVFCVLLGVGALDGPSAVTLAWAVLGGLAAGLAYELPARGSEAGALRGEVYSGLSTGAFALAKAAVLLPVLAVADLLVLAVPAIGGRLPGGFGPAYLAVAISSAVGLAAALAVAVTSARRS